MRIRILAAVASTSTVLMGSTAFAQTAQKVIPTFGIPVSGRDSEFTVNLSLNPGAIDISGFSMIVAYDNTQVQLKSVSDNTGQPASAAEYTMGTQHPFSGTSGVNVYVPVIMDTAFSLQLPVKIAELKFRSTPEFNDNVYILLEDYLDEGLVDAEFQPIPTEYGIIQPATAVDNWTMY